MKSVIIGLCMLLFIFAAQAGTFLDTFDDEALVNYQELVMFGINVHGPSPWEIIDGELEIINKGAPRLLTIGEERWQDYDIEFNVKPLEKHGPGIIMIAARIKGTWGVVCGIDDLAGPAVEPIATCWGGNLRGLSFVTYNKKPHRLLKLRKWATFKLSVHGKRLTFWINGKQVLGPVILEAKIFEDGVEFPDYPTGRIGLGLTNYTARFDNFKATGPGVPNTDGLSVTSQTKLATTWGNLKQARDNIMPLKEK